MFISYLYTCLVSYDEDFQSLSTHFSRKLRIIMMHTIIKYDNFYYLFMCYTLKSCTIDLNVKKKQICTFLLKTKIRHSSTDKNRYNVYSCDIFSYACPINYPPVRKAYLLNKLNVPFYWLFLSSFVIICNSIIQKKNLV